MKKNLLILSAALLFASASFAQEKLTLYYDANGKGVDTKKNAVFYRVVTYDNLNNPAGPIHDFYMNDKPMAEGVMANLDKLDNTKSRWTGGVTTYNEKGKVTGHWNYDENGFLDGAQSTLSAEGQKEQEMEYHHGNPAKDYYLFYDKKGNTARYSYLTHRPMMLSTSDKDIVPFTNKQVEFEDGQLQQFYNLNGITIAVKISVQKQYGEYYQAFITIQNGSNPQFDFDPTGITASLEIGGEVEEGIVFSYDDYMKKVKARQGLGAALLGVVEVANVVASSTSTSSTTVTAKNSKGKTESIKAKTTTFDGAAASAAADQAAGDMNQLAAKQNAAKQGITEGYLKANTVYPNSQIAGFVNIKYSKANRIYLNIPVNGKVYHFEI